MSEKKDSIKIDKTPVSPENISGILKEKDNKDLEDRIVETLKWLNSKLTRKEIMELFSRVEVSKWLDWLKNQLEKEKKLWGKKLDDEVLQIILDLIKEAKEVTQKWIEELRIELNKLNESKLYNIDNSLYPSSKLAWVKELEESELWKNIFKDIAWISVWLFDSAEALFKLLLGLIKDIVVLPRDLVRLSKNKK
jgi:hypothetical protein